MAQWPSRLEYTNRKTLLTKYQGLVAGLNGEAKHSFYREVYLAADVKAFLKDVPEVLQVSSQAIMFKVGGAMMEVKIPFRPFFSVPIRSGVKVMTCRTKRMGDPGDRFHAFGETFTITHVMRMRLGYVIADCFEQEGCKSVQELTEVWNAIHPLRKVDPEQIVWAHCFRKEPPA